MYTLWYSGKPALPLFSASGVNGDPTYTHERQFLGRIRSPSLVYSGRYRSLFSAVFVCCRCAKTTVPMTPRPIIPTATIRCFFIAILLLRRAQAATCCGREPCRVKGQRPARADDGYEQLRPCGRVIESNHATSAS